MEMEDHPLQDHHQELRHVCKFCSKSFACGRSLGGHMRSHMINDTSAQADGSKITRKKLPPLSTYLMSNPNSTNTKKKKKKKKKRSKRRTRCTGPANFSSVSFANNASSSASEVELEQEEVATCLILLSRDVGRWGGSNSDNSSVSTRSTEVKNSQCEVKLKSLGDLRSEDPEEEVVPDGCNHLIKRKSVDSFDPEMKPDQMLVTDCVDRAETSNVARKSKGHECPICLKVFPSGQALGGHKRAHLVGAPNDHHRAKTVLQPVAAPSGPMILDLNLPAPVEEESNGLVCFNPWWLGKSNHNCEPLLGLIFN